MTLTLAACALCPALAAAAPGDFDGTFGRNGIAAIDAAGFDLAFALATQPDGKIVVTGKAGGSPDDDIVVSRLNANGTPDTGFDADGIRRIHGPGAEDLASAVEVQPDGKIVVVAFRGAGVSNSVVYRLNQDGSFDPTFDADGIVVLDSGSHDEVFGVAVQPDGKIVVAGSTSTNNDAVVYRLDDKGARDPSFGTNGEQRLDSGGTEQALALALQPDGKIVVAGYTTVNDDAVVYRLNEKGARDPSFDDDGERRVNSGGREFAFTLALQSDGKLVIAGQTSFNGDAAAVYRLNADGTSDTTFDRDGAVRLDRGPGDVARELALQPDGKILVAGGTGIGEDQSGLMYRLLEDGARDVTFDGDGELSVDVDGFSVAHGLALQPDGKLLLAGDHIVGPDSRDIMVLRLLGDDPVVAPPPPAPGAPAPSVQPSAPVADRLAPRVTGVRRSDTRLRFTLSEPASIRIVIQRARPGHRSGNRCVRKGRGRRCTRYTPAGTITRRNVPAGANTVPLSARTLRPGRYRATITATDTAGNRSTPTRAAFTIKRQASR